MTWIRSPDKSWILTSQRSLVRSSFSALELFTVRSRSLMTLITLINKYIIKKLQFLFSQHVHEIEKNATHLALSVSTCSSSVILFNKFLFVSSTLRRTTSRSENREEGHQLLHPTGREGQLKGWRGRPFRCRIRNYFREVLHPVL